MKKISLSLVLSLMLLTIMTNFAYADWVMENGHFRYKTRNSYVIENWKKIDDINYYFDAEGNMVTGLHIIGENVHAFNQDGAPYKDGIKIDGKYYRIEGNKGKVKDLTIHDDIDALNDILLGVHTGAAIDQYVESNPLISAEEQAKYLEQAALQAQQNAAMNELNKISMGETTTTVVKIYDEDDKVYNVTMTVPTIVGQNVEVVNRINETIKTKFVSAMESSVSLSEYLERKKSKNSSLTVCNLDTTSLNENTIIFSWIIPVKTNYSDITVVVRAFYDMATGNFYAN